MADRRMRKRTGQAVEHRLVGDFAGQTDIARREVRGSTAHQELAPVRRRPGDVGDAARAQPCHVIRDGFSGLRQHHRSAADHRAQEYLQAAVAADVVERRPGRVRVARSPFGDDCAGKSIERMSDDLGRP